MTDLQKAIEALGAVEVAPGRIAIKGENEYGQPCWHILATGVYQDNVAQGITEFSFQEVLATMPSWWSPDRRFADRCSTCKAVENVDPRDHIGDCRCEAGEYWERITASLETGEEVPA